MHFGHVTVLGDGYMLKLCIPTPDELWLKKMMLEDAATMSYNHAYGGTIDFPESRWEEWYAKWVSCSDGSKYYRYLIDGDIFVGEAAYHLEDGRYLADILIYAPQRGKGYGREALSLLIEKAAENGIEELFDSIAADNAAAISLFSFLGFETVKKDSETVLVRKRIKK
jgi:diamine N-acetyltransferase